MVGILKLVQNTDVTKFIHAVATKDAGYSRRMEALLKEEFTQKGQPPPPFYASFWGNVLKQTGQIWNWIHQDLQDLKKNYPQVDITDVFRYQEFRHDFISEFFGDIFTYFNTKRGRKIRELIAEDLNEFIKAFPTEDELHIITQQQHKKLLPALKLDHLNKLDIISVVKTCLILRVSSPSIAPSCVSVKFSSTNLDMS